MGYAGQLAGQNFNFFMHRLVFVHDKQFLAFNGAKAASDLNSRNLEVLFGNGNLHSFRQVLELLIQLIGFHDINALHHLKITACVLLLSNIKNS